MEKSHWYVDQDVLLYHVAVHGYGGPLSSLVGAAQSLSPYRVAFEPPIMSAFGERTRGVISFEPRKGLFIVTRQQQTIMQCVAYKTFAQHFMMKLLEAAELVTLPITDRLRAYLKDQHFDRKYDFIHLRERLARIDDYVEIAEAVIDFENQVSKIERQIRRENGLEERINRHVARSLKSVEFT